MNRRVKMPSDENSSEKSKLLNSVNCAGNDKKRYPFVPLD